MFSILRVSLKMYCFIRSDKENISDGEKESNVAEETNGDVEHVESQEKSDDEETEQIEVMKAK